MKRYWLLLAILASMGMSSCRPLIEDSSAAALKSGNATMLLGGCSREIGMGYDVCQLTRGKPLPKLHFGFLNPAEWMVTDCHGNVFKSGKLDKPGLVELDLSALNLEIQELGVCWLRLEAVELYPSPQDPNQFQRIGLAGGFIIELLAEGYMPVPSDDSVGWCYTIKRTTAGRTTVTRCL